MKKGIIIILALLILFPFMSATIINVPLNYSSIQDAIDNANNYDTIRISNGSYSEDLLIDKKLTIIGNGTSNSTILNGKHFITSDDVTLSKIIFISGASETTITIDTSTESLDNIEILNCVFNLTTSPTVGINVGGDYNKVRKIKIKNNIFNGPSDMICNPFKIGGSFTSPISAEVNDLEFQNNIVNYCSIPINLDDENLKNILINNNSFYNTDGALYIWGEDSPTGVLSNFVFTNNIIDSSNSYGVGIFGFDGDLTDTVFSDSNFGPGNRINYNSFIGIAGAYGLNATSILATLSSYKLDAEYNYWGSCDGPSGAGPGSGSAVSEDVDFFPWLGICIIDRTKGECAIESTDMYFIANFSGTELEEVWISYTINGINKNITFSNYNMNEYEINISKLELFGGKNITYHFYASDKYGILYNNTCKDLYVREKTKVIINPSSPNGDNGWYVSEPEFSLTSDPNASYIYYWWDSVPNGPFLYNASFGLDNIPNAPPIESAGILDLKYWANFDNCGFEPINIELFYVDLTDPIIKDFTPKNNSVVYNLRPKISAYLDEFFQSNSGINENSIILKIDGTPVSPSITEIGLDASISYTPTSDLSEGSHSASITVSDNAGRTSTVSWPFKVSQTPALTMQVHSPLNTIYNQKRILFDISIEEVLELEYIDWSQKNPRFRRLCRNCASYNRQKTFRDGEHNVSIIATDEYSNVNEKYVTFLVDSRAPRISKTEPRRRVVTNGSEFYVKFSEENPVKLDLVIEETDIKNINLSECTKVRSYTECEFEMNLSKYNGETINYYFTLTDIADSSTKSRPTEITVDTLAPKINNNITEDLVVQGRRVIFNIDIIEENFEEATYSYIDERGRLREKKLCTRLKYNTCERRTNFREGNYTLTINVLDEAGNSVSEEVKLEV